MKPAPPPMCWITRHLPARGSANAFMQPSRAAGRTIRRLPIVISMLVAIGVAAPMIDLAMGIRLSAEPYTHPLLRSAIDGADWLPTLTGDERSPADLQQESLAFLATLLIVLAASLVAIALVVATSLLLVQAVGRRAEIALRTVLGARRGRLFRELGRDGAPLLVLWAGAGLLLACGTAVILDGTWPSGDAPWGALQRPGPVSVGSAIVLVLALTLAWLSPVRIAWATDLRRYLVVGTRATPGPLETGRRQILAVLQIALLLVLLTSAGLLLRAFGSSAGGSDTGFDPRDRITAQVDLARMDGAAEKREFEWRAAGQGDPDRRKRCAVVYRGGDRGRCACRRDRLQWRTHPGAVPVGAPASASGNRRGGARFA